MKDVLKHVDVGRERGDAIALATVISVKRSAPRPPGSKMAVNEHGEISGAVSGGCVEGAVVEVAEQVLRTGEPQLLHFGIAASGPGIHVFEYVLHESPSSISSASASSEAIEFPGNRWSTCGSAACIPRVKGT
jgi:xanthine dehydrogenase accessory factor